jgi:hypothetical protein
MAEETLVKENLTEDMIRLGAELTRKLDAANWPVKASLWLFNSENNTWRLILASPQAATSGPKGAYEVVQSALSNLPGRSLTLKDIVVVTPQDPLIQSFQSALQTGPDIKGLRFSRNTINGHFIDDAYIYRINL